MTPSHSAGEYNGLMSDSTPTLHHSTGIDLGVHRVNQPQTSRRGSGSKPGGQITESTNNTRLVSIAIVFQQETAPGQPIARGFSRQAKSEIFGTLSTDTTTGVCAVLKPTARCRFQSHGFALFLEGGLPD
jgi:hypothetical protein